MYRWVDQNGATVYSQSPPPSGEATAIPQQPAPRPADVEAARKRLQQQLEKEFDAQQAASDRAAKHAAEQEARKRDDETCAAARRNLETITRLGSRRVVTPEGDEVYLSDERRRELTDEARDQIEKYCR